MKYRFVPPPSRSRGTILKMLSIDPLVEGPALDGGLLWIVAADSPCRHRQLHLGAHDPGAVARPRWTSARDQLEHVRLRDGEIERPFRHCRHWVAFVAPEPPRWTDLVGQGLLGHPGDRIQDRVLVGKMPVEGRCANPDRRRKRRHAH